MPVENAMITGTPGIGKSFSFFHFLPRFLQEGRRVVHEDQYEKSLSMFEKKDGKLRAYRFDLIKQPHAAAFLEKFMGPEDIVFRDWESYTGDIAPFPFPCRMEIILSSPRRSGFGRYLKYVPGMAQLCLPPHSLDELHKFAGEAVPKEDLAFMHGMFNGVLRWCLERPYDEFEWGNFFHLLVKREAAPLVELCSGPSRLADISNTDDKKFPHRLQTLEATEQCTFHQWTYPSLFVEELLYQSQYLQKEHFAKRMLSDEDLLRLDDKIFERGCARALVDPHPHNIDCKEASFKEVVVGTKKKWKTDWDKAGTFALPHREKINRSALTNEKELFVPTQQTYETVDFISSEGGFNATLADKHDFKQAGFNKAKKVFNRISPGKEFKMYWLVRQDVFESGHFQLKNRASQFVRDVPHFLLPHQSTQLTGMDLKNDISEALFHAVSEFKSKNQCSERLSKVVSIALSLETRIN
eukprot:CAMPEP_0174251282 /NCGR_PEP_ID=MMETSP0439-20130205/1150_1 /TAXON_ID=0 /ORGANISM="Stereomyxa ramosa, Strain Chinc5" /LENGTH=467 /DNA_ID=CAMNT_0015331553 /DNA_START=304 /DNA_END=1707 /DNA_ORIENTATION=+